MKWAIKIVYLSYEIPRYVLQIDDGITYKQILNPEFATTWELKKNAVEWLNENLDKEKYYKVVKLDPEIELWKILSADGIVHSTCPCIDKKLSVNYNNETPKEVLKWTVKVAHAPETSIKQEHYSSWPPLYSVFNTLVGYNGYYKNNNFNQKRFTAFFDLNSEKANFEDFKKELKLVLPYVDLEIEIKHKKNVFVGKRINVKVEDDWNHGNSDFVVLENGKFLIVSNKEVVYDTLKQLYIALKGQ